MKTFLEKDFEGNWNTIPLVPKDKVGNINCHKFILYVIGKISWEELVSGTPGKGVETDFTFSEIARSISDAPFVLVKDLESLYLLADKGCEIGETYVGQILDAQTGELAHSFIIQKGLDGKYSCLDKPGFKYPFSVHGLEEILNFVNKDGEKSNRDQMWRFVSFAKFSPVSIVIIGTGL